MTKEERERQEGTKRPVKESISERLEKLKTDKRRSQTAILAENLGSVEKALSEGIPRVAVWEALREEGLTLTFKSFETFLHRLRKRGAAQSPAPSPPSVRTSSSAQAPPKPSPATPTTAPVSVAPTLAVDTEEAEFEAFKKSIAHLPVVQRGKKTADYYEQKEKTKLSPLVQKHLDKDK